MGFRGLIKEKYVNEMAALLSDTLTSLYCMETGIVSQCRGLSRGPWGVTIQKRRRTTEVPGDGWHVRELQRGSIGLGSLWSRLILSYLLLTDAGEVS